MLTLNRPEKLNALDTQAFEEFDAHLEDLERQTDTIGCVLLKSNGRAFCAGADLNAMGVGTDGTPLDPRFKPRIVQRLAELPQPVIAAVNGVCFTGGLELALACNFIVADETARFADTHGKWGLVGAWGMMQRLPRRIGVARAQDLMMTGREVDAREAQAIGLVDRVVDTGKLEEASRDLASAILANSWHTNFAVKRSQIETEAMPIATALAHDHYSNPGNSPDHTDRLKHFNR